MSTAAPVATRLTAVDRREAILQAAMEAFAEKGLHGTSTETIARNVGISQPYLFRLYGTKKELFLAAIRRCFDDTLERLPAAVYRVPHVEQNLEVELLPSIGKIERHHRRVVASGLGAFEGLAVHLVEVGEDTFTGSGHSRILYGALCESR